MNKDVGKKILNYLMDVGLVAWISLFFGLIIFINRDFSEYPLHIIFGFIAITYGMIRIHAAADKHDIIREIKSIKNKSLK